jgi:hypothetical protein
MRAGPPPLARPLVAVSFTTHQRGSGDSATTELSNPNGVRLLALLAVRGVAQRFGGSHAQRDVLTLTALHAALRGGLRGAAEALGAERISHKPESPWARRLARRAELLA